MQISTTPTTTKTNTTTATSTTTSTRRTTTTTPCGSVNSKRKTTTITAATSPQLTFVLLLMLTALMLLHLGECHGDNLRSVMQAVNNNGASRKTRDIESAPPNISPIVPTFHKCELLNVSVPLRLKYLYKKRGSTREQVLDPEIFGVRNATYPTQYALVPRCVGGKCPLQESCQPTTTRLENYQFDLGARNFIGVSQNVEVHDACSCSCEIKEHHCTEKQDYDGCKCTCKNDSSCDRTTHELDLETCECACRVQTPCDTGYKPYNCDCVPVATNTDITFTSRRRFIVKAERVPLDNSTVYEY